MGLSKSVEAQNTPSIDAQIAEVAGIDLARMSFREFESMALRSDPVLAKLKAQVRGLKEKAIADDSLPDPRLKVGLMNLPVDNLVDFEQEPMTQKLIGISQTFPPFGSLDHQRARTEALATAMEAEAAARELEVLRNVRNTWLELYFQFEAEKLIQISVRTFAELVDVARFRYRAGRGNQHDLVRAQMELALLNDRLRNIEITKFTILARMGRWIGIPRINASLPLKFPNLPNLPSYDEIRAAIGNHPAVQAAVARVQAGRAGEKAAKSLYFPKVMLEFTYGQRDFDRADLVSGMLSLELPFFPGKRQSRLLASSRQETGAARSAMDQQRRVLNEMLEAEFARWNRLEERFKLYKNEVIPLSSQFAESSMNAYRTGVSDFAIQARARLAELDNGIEALRVQIERSKAHANLLYIYGERTL